MTTIWGNQSSCDFCTHFLDVAKPLNISYVECKLGDNVISIDYSGVEVNYNTYDVKQKIAGLKKEAIPAFYEDKPPLKQMKTLAAKYSKYKNVIVVGNGGSITSSFAFYKSLGSKKKLHILDTMEPDYINELKKACPIKDTIVIVISKSGNTVGVLESALAFIKYEIIAVTSKNDGTLYQIAKKNDMEFLEHPVVGGRYSGRTSCGLFPSAILGLDIDAINTGALDMYKKCAFDVDIEKNPALKLSAILRALDKRGYHEVFMPIYSRRLWGFNNLIVQLIHESSGKEGKGQTIFGALAPESQHHTNQRFFGGKKNMMGLFVTVGHQDDNDTATKVPTNLKDIVLRDGTLSDIEGIPLSKSLEFEFTGTKRDADNNRIPNIVVTLEKINPHSVGEFLGFWQFVAVYSSYLRGVEPFDQPQVENSKEISFEMRREYNCKKCK